MTTEARMTQMARFERFQVTVTVYGLPRGKERAFRREVAGAGHNFRLPFERLGGKFELRIQVVESEVAENLRIYFQSCAERLGAKFVKGEVYTALDWDADTDEMVAAAVEDRRANPVEHGRLVVRQYGPHPDQVEVYTAVPSTIVSRPFEQEEDEF
jgi:hypothetical protein